MRRNIITTVATGILFSFQAMAQEVEQTPLEQVEQRVETLESDLSKLKKLKVSGYIQAQYQHGEAYSDLKVGAVNENFDKSFDRIGIRRGRIKFAYEDGIASGVFQLDLTEKGIGFKDVYLNVKDPWFQTSALRAGVFDRPFGYEISYSSSRRESPERSTVFQTLFPEERDLGAMMILQAAKTSPWNFLKLEAGLFAGNGIKQETDSKKDFIGHLSAVKLFDNSMSLSGGISYYHGFVFQGTENVYTMAGSAFVLNTNPSNKGGFAKRQYFGIDAEFAAMSSLGQTRLSTEYVFGQQPGGQLTSKSPNTSVALIRDIYIRDFSGAYVMLVQDFGQSPFSAVLKYDYYDPNTKVAGDEIGLNNTGIADVTHHTYGFGGLWRINNNLRLQAYYEVNKNEQTANLEAANGDIKNDVFTLRLQYKF